jgi:hypothetical protein
VGYTIGMEDLTSPSPPEPVQEDVLVQTLQRQRSQADTFLAAHRKRLLAAEANLVERIDRIARELAQVRAQEGPVEGDDSRRRYELALEDLRTLRAENEALNKRLAEARTAGVSLKAPVGESLGWEAQKQRLLEALEAEQGEGDAEAAEERLRIEQLIETTDRVVAEKDREIGELQVLLREQTGQVGAVAVGAEAFAETIDKDAIIREERENLKRLQEELREKLRKGEVDLSIERAKIARERLEIEEKARTLGDQHGAGPPTPQKTSRGRWLSRLGLGNTDENDA